MQSVVLDTVTVYDLEHDTAPAGVTTLLVDHQVRTAEYLILLAPHARGRGLAPKPPC